MNVPAELELRFEEIKKLYNLSDADLICLTQIILTLNVLGYPSQLMVRLLRALVTLWEVSLDFNEAKRK